MSEEKTLIRKLTIYGGFLLALLLAVGLSIVGYTHYAEWRVARVAEKKEQDHRFAQEQIRDMVKFCDFAKLDTDEQASIDKCGDDVIAVRTALDRLLDDRVTYWQSKKSSIEDDAVKLVNVKNNASYWDNSLENQFTSAPKTLASKHEMAKLNIKGWTDKREAFKTYNPLKKEKMMRIW